MAYVENATHNPEVVGSNPAPATKKLQLVGYAGELFLLLSGCEPTIFRLCLLIDTMRHAHGGDNVATGERRCCIEGRNGMY